MSALPGLDFKLTTIGREVPAPAPEPAASTELPGIMPWGEPSEAMPAACPKCGAGFLPLLLVTTDGSRRMMCGSCRRWRKSEP